MANIAICSKLEYKGEGNTNMKNIDKRMYMMVNVQTARNAPAMKCR